MKNTKPCTACGRVPKQTYDVGVFLGNWAKKGPYCMECLEKVYLSRGKMEAVLSSGEGK